MPATVSTLIRFPLSWLSFHNLPMRIYKFLSNWTFKNDGYLNIYLHPWEFTNLNQPEKFNFPGYVVKNSGEALVSRMEDFIIYFKHKKYPFGTFKEFIATIK